MIPGFRLGLFLFSFFFWGGGGRDELSDPKFLQISNRYFRELAVSFVTNIRGSRGISGPGNVPNRT
jgi:hypothetical protein